MIEVGVYEAKTRLPGLLDRVARGERVTITRHGVPVAMLVPIASAQKAPVDEAIAELRSFGRGRRLGISIRSAIQRGCRRAASSSTAQSP